MCMWPSYTLDVTDALGKDQEKRVQILFIVAATEPTCAREYFFFFPLVLGFPPTTLTATVAGGPGLVEVPDGAG